MLNNTSFDVIKLVFLGKTRVFDYITRLADSRIAKSSHLYTTRLVSRLWLQSLLTCLEAEWRVGTLTRRSLIGTFQIRKSNGR